MVNGSRQAYSQGADLTPEAIPWYDWEADEPDHGWLLTYVDVLSVILAMVVVLLGRMAVEQLPATVPPDLVVHSDDQIATPLPTTKRVDVPARPPLPAPVATPEERFSELVAQRFAGQVTAVRKEHGVAVEIADVILFESARAQLQPSALPILTRLATTLEEIGAADIAVEGHTDNRPMQGSEFTSNWELAAARANSVTRFLLSQGLAAERLRAVSYGDTRPVADNASPVGQAANRRVELRVEFLES